MNLAGKNLLIFEEALCGYDGHYYEWIKSVREMHLARGAQVHIFANSTVLPAIQKEIGAVPLFTHNCWDGSYFHSNPLRRYQAIPLHNLRTYWAIAPVLRRFSQIDCILLPKVKIHQLVAWRILLGIHMPQRIQRFAAQLNHSEGTYRPGNPQPVFKGTSHLNARILRSIYTRGGATRICFGSDSDQTSAEYFQLSGVPFAEFTTPRTATRIARRKDAAHPGKLHFLSPGSARHEKGSGLLQAAILRHFDNHPDSQVRFTIQWPVDLKTADGAIISLDRRLLDDPRVTVIQRSTSTEEYSALLGSADCILAPYRWTPYFSRISGAVVEAATAGIPLIYTKGTWLARATERYGAGLAVHDGNVDSLAAAIHEMEREIVNFTRLAAERMEMARKIHSPDAFLETLWGETVQS
ncbi:MAG: glycosyltransferase [Verrucomicrobiae bacterium]